MHRDPEPRQEFLAVPGEAQAQAPPRPQASQHSAQEFQELLETGNLECHQKKKKRMRIYIYYNTLTDIKCNIIDQT